MGLKEQFEKVSLDLEKALAERNSAFAKVVDLERLQKQNAELAEQLSSALTANTTLIAVTSDRDRLAKQVKDLTSEQEVGGRLSPKLAALIAQKQKMGLMPEQAAECARRDIAQEAEELAKQTPAVSAVKPVQPVSTAPVK